MLKLRACWHFKQGAYDLAATDFQRVLSADPKDQEAGINMALIDIHDQQYETAMKRLKQLRDLYPDNTVIADLLKRMR